MTATSDVKERVRQLLPNFRERAAELEKTRRVSDESIQELREAGFFRMLQPAVFGGLEGDPVDFYETVKLISSACGSTGPAQRPVGLLLGQCPRPRRPARRPDPR
ncbi:acyl-CoA dehydrogenase family protein [Nocardioides sp.]|uniref:acyl-CoA dehydrogenase family protein n=1 Tax=Nocardioides sp. TaxID=35761 RepID=UPI002620F61D|nr:acyl-CoA dehydrogenase family protein [Nocardioides sp.]